MNITLKDMLDAKLFKSIPIVENSALKGSNKGYYFGCFVQVSPAIFNLFKGAKPKLKKLICENLEIVVMPTKEEAAGIKFPIPKSDPSPMTSLFDRLVDMTKPLTTNERAMLLGGEYGRSTASPKGPETEGRGRKKPVDGSGDTGPDNRGRSPRT